jgi:hypothetical protein
MVLTANTSHSGPNLSLAVAKTPFTPSATGPPFSYGMPSSGTSHVLSYSTLQTLGLGAGSSNAPLQGHMGGTHVPFNAFPYAGGHISPSSPSLGGSHQQSTRKPTHNSLFGVGSQGPPSHSMSVGSIPFSWNEMFDNNAFSSTAFPNGGNPIFGQSTLGQGTILAQGQPKFKQGSPSFGMHWCNSVKLLCSTRTFTIHGPKSREMPFRSSALGSSTHKLYSVIFPARAIGRSDLAGSRDSRCCPRESSSRKPDGQSQPRVIPLTPRALTFQLPECQTSDVALARHLDPLCLRGPTLPRHLRDFSDRGIRDSKSFTAESPTAESPILRIRATCPSGNRRFQSNRGFRFADPTCMRSLRSPTPICRCPMTKKLPLPEG